MRFFRSAASPEKPEPAGRVIPDPVIPDPVIPDEADLIKSMLSAYRNPAITSTAALHLDVSARHPAWRVTPRRVRKLLCKVAAQHDAETWVACGEDEVEDWCVIRAPVVVQKAASVSALWAARLRQGGKLGPGGKKHDDCSNKASCNEGSFRQAHD